MLQVLEAGVRACNQDSEFKQELQSIQTFQIILSVSSVERQVNELYNLSKNEGKIKIEAKKESMDEVTQLLIEVGRHADKLKIEDLRNV